MVDALARLYELKKTIGTGGFAKVKLAVHCLTGEKVAIKIMEKSKLGDDMHRVKLELEALKSFSHRHICKLYEVIETDTHFFIVIEYCSGGELFDYIVDQNRITESDSRMYFRQIVSAVAHLHHLGFVHRDLKPENILLDSSHNLKLIDFGLCAKPQGGIESHLYTSCGSPSYAAPELVLGKKYLGSEVDVWSLGVLLFALLCGYLPFDDNNLQTLYSKIISGKYPEAQWMSDSSKRLIRSMLQVDPMRRISIEQLLSHPWLLAGGKGPVLIREAAPPERDEQCLSVLAAHHGLSSRAMWARLSRWTYDHDCATYLLLLARKRRGANVRIIASAMPFRSRKMTNVNAAEKVDRPSDPVSTIEPNRVTEKTYFVLNGKESTPDDTPMKAVDKENAMSPHRKRYHSPEPSPVPNKITPGRNFAVRGNVNQTPSPTSNGKEADRSYGTYRIGEWQVLIRDSLEIPAQVFQSPAGVDSPSRSARKLFERGLNRVRHVLTPRRRQAVMARDGPTILSPKGLCNLSTTSSNNPDEVLSKLHQALITKGIIVKRNGFTLRGKLEACAANGKAKVCKLSFELEVCIVESGQVKDRDNESRVVGIKRKRLRGDAWCYKKVCEEVLSLANNAGPLQTCV